MKAMIFAAGLGTRLRPLTDHMPKALVPVAGVPMLQRVILRLKEADFHDIVINIHHFGEQILDFLKANDNFGVRIHISDERGELLDTLIHQMETMQDRTSRNQERIQQIDKEIADLGAKNHIIARLHTSGALTAVEYAMQTSEIGNRLTELRIERRQKLTEDEDDQRLAATKDLNGILEEYEPTAKFDNGLFDEIIENITVDSSEQLTFKLLGGIALTEKIPKKGRCKTA